MAPNFLKPGSSHEQAERERERLVRHGHDAADSSWPPPSAVTRPKQQSSPIIETVKKHGDLWDSARKITVAVVTIGGIVVAAFTYVVKIIIRSEIDDFKARIDPAALVQIVKPGVAQPPGLGEKLDSISTSVAHVNEKVTDFISNENGRFNKLDEILLKNFGDSTSPTKPPPPPAFGPKAKQQGR